MRPFLLLFALVWASGTAWAERRVAFVVGNASYENTAPLANPVNDARLISETLEEIGFEVTRHEDLGRDALARALSAFVRETAESDVTFFYFAGHGIQLDGENYLLGTDATLQSEFDVVSEGLALSDISDILRRRSKAALIFIDACRDNPLADAFYAEYFPQARSLATRGLAPTLSATAGTMLVFAASPGQVAYDGTGRNSPFSLALARHLPTENAEVLSLMKRVIRDTRMLTGGRQSPTITNDLAEDIFLRRVAMAVPATPSPSELAAKEWEDFRDSTSEEALERFALKYPDTAYAALARERSNSLRAQKAQSAERNPLEQDAAPSIDPPDWCSSPQGPAQDLVCRSPALMAQEARIAALYRARLDTLRGGDAYGEVLLEHAAWGKSRDSCSDQSCLDELYERRAIALMGLPNDLTPDEQVVYLAQTELNRLGCGAGVPDGRIGPRTRSALALLARNSDRIAADADVGSIELLTQLRNVEAAECSVLLRATREPDLLAGTWKHTSVCDRGSSLAEGSYVGILSIRHVGDGRYTARFDNNYIARRTNFIGDLAPDGRITFVERDVERGRFARKYSFAPGEAPFEMVGRSHFRCDEVARRD